MELTFSIFDAYNQILMLFIGFVFFAVGGLMIGFAFWSQFGGVRVVGKIIGVRMTGQKTPDAAKIAPMSAPTVEKPKRGGVSYLILIVPLIFIGVASWFGVDYVTLKAGGVAVVGQVVDIETHQSDEGGNTYAPVIAFTDQAGQYHRKADRISTGWGNKTKIGTPQNIVYDPKKPEHFIIDSFWHNMAIPLAFGGFGGLFLCLMLWAKSREGRPAVEKEDKYSARDMYYPVFEYTAPDGQVLQAESNTGSNMISGMIPGTTKNIGLKKDDYTSVTESGWLLYIFGVIFGTPGVVLLYMGVTQFKFNVMMPVIVIGILVLLGMKIARVIKPRDLWESRATFRAKMKQKRLDKVASGRVLSAQEFNDRLAAADKVSLMSTPILVILALSVMAGGGYWWQHQAEFESLAVSAQGEVTGMSTSTNSDHETMYHAQVRFMAEGQSVTFRDSIGSNHPTHRKGDQVKVLYDPTDTSSAQIDRGWLSRLPGMGLVALGLLMLLAAGRNLAAISRRKC